MNDELAVSMANARAWDCKSTTNLAFIAMCVGTIVWSLLTLRLHGFHSNLGVSTILAIHIVAVQLAIEGVCREVGNRLHFRLLLGPNGLSAKVWDYRALRTVNIETPLHGLFLYTDALSAIVASRPGSFPLPLTLGHYRTCRDAIEAAAAPKREDSAVGSPLSGIRDARSGAQRIQFLKRIQAEWRPVNESAADLIRFGYDKPGRLGVLDSIARRLLRPTLTIAAASVLLYCRW
jgi:hypothetical protein